MDKEKNFGTKVGQFVGNTLVICVAACLCAIAIALTVRFVAWLF